MWKGMQRRFQVPTTNGFAFDVLIWSTVGLDHLNFPADTSAVLAWFFEK